MSCYVPQDDRIKVFRERVPGRAHHALGNESLSAHARPYVAVI